MARRPTLGSLFTGIQGLDLAVQTAFGAQVAWHCEAPPIEDPRTSKERRQSKLRDYLLSRLEERHPDLPIIEGVENVASKASKVDIIAGGFPCIDVSQAGRRAGLEGEHSGLWWEMEAAISELEPSIVVIENVRGLVNRGLSEVVGSLADLGYDAEWYVLGACCVGAPHIRERVFVLAWRGGPPSLADGRMPDPGWKDGSWWTDATTPDFDGRQERLAALGNACSPQQAMRALSVLSERASSYAMPAAPRVDGQWQDEWDKWPCSGAVRDGWLSLRTDIHHRLDGCIRNAKRIHQAPLPTPTASEYGSSGNGTGNNVESRGRPSLAALAGSPKHAPLPTPTTQDGHNDGAPSQMRRNSLPLNAVAATLPTPTAGDAKAAGSRNLEGSSANAGVSLTDAVCRGGSDVGGRGTPKLNPVFVERMMGFPDHWSAIAQAEEKEVG